MRAGVVGAGLMAAEIALVFALAGHDVVLHDRSEPALVLAVDRLRTILGKGRARQLYTPETAGDALARIGPTTDLAALANCEVVTEAVFESLEAKSSMLTALDALCRPTCIFASNTSTLPISTLASCLAPERRGRFLGTHYFSPVSRMSLVEVILGFATDTATVTQVTAILRDIGKQPVAIKDVAGFAVNRMLHALLIEAVKLLEEGVATPAVSTLPAASGWAAPSDPSR